MLLGNGDGTFQSPVDYGAGRYPGSIATGDLDGDGALDLAVANYSDNDVSVLLGNGDGTLQSPVDYGVANGPTSIATGDLDGDGALDLAVTKLRDIGHDNLSVLLGNGDGTFQSPVDYPVGTQPRSLATGDLNGDGALDLAVANSGSDNVSVLIGLTASATVEIDIKPASDTNTINPFSRGVIAVAILGSATFDVGDLDLGKLAFGPAGAAPAFDLTNPLVYWLSHWDVNGDGRKDLLSSYRTAETGIAMGDTEACLTGETLDGKPFEGCDVVTTTLPPWSCGLGAELALLLPPLMWLWRRRLHC